jgi:hypothetical protein
VVLNDTTNNPCQARAVPKAITLLRANPESSMLPGDQVRVDDCAPDPSSKADAANNKVVAGPDRTSPPDDDDIPLRVDDGVPDPSSKADAANNKVVAEFDRTSPPDDDDIPLSQLRIASPGTVASPDSGDRSLQTTAPKKKTKARQKLLTSKSTMQASTSTQSTKPDGAVPKRTAELGAPRNLPSKDPLPDGTLLTLKRADAKLSFGFGAGNGKPKDPVLVGTIKNGGIAQAAGLQVGMSILTANGVPVRFKSKDVSNLNDILPGKLELVLQVKSDNSKKDPPPRAVLAFYHCSMHGTELVDWEPFQKSYVDPYLAEGKLLSTGECCGRPLLSPGTNTPTDTDFHGNKLPERPARAVCGRRGATWSQVKQTKSGVNCFYACRACNKDFDALSEAERKKVAVLCQPCYDDHLGVGSKKRKR